MSTLRARPAPGRPSAPRQESPPRASRGRLGPGAAAATVWYLRVMALLNLLSVVSASFRDEVRDHNAGQYFTPYLATAGLVTVVLACFLAVVMRRRKRAAWLFNMALACPLLLLYALAMTSGQYRGHGFNWFSLVLTALFVAALVAGRREFRARGDRCNPGLALAVFAGGLTATGVVGTLLVNVTNTVAGASLGDQISYALLRVVTLVPSSDDFDAVATPRWVDAVINVLAALLFLLVLYVCFRAPRGRKLLTTEDEEQLRALLDRYGERDSLGYFALRRDKAVVWSPSRKAAVTYRVVGGVTLASGDPLGDPEAWPGAIDQWLRQARDHAWVPAVIGAGEEAGTVYARHGFDALELGDEAIVERAGFTLEGRAVRSVRQAHNRVRRAGYTVRIRRQREIPPEEMADLLDRADRWREGEVERGFSMALDRLGDPADGCCLVVECHDVGGALRAVLSFVPWGCRGLSLDVMRRDRDADNGLVEFMVVELLQRAAQVGVDRVSLNFAVFRAVFERSARLGAGPVLRLWRAVLSFFSRWWQIESLYRANAKYRPVWKPRYLLFEKSSELPRVGLACARAEGFLAVPALHGLVGWRRRRADAAEPPLHLGSAA
ncbi:phosphatidylglycerol lysyltransferase domain-containing protein [Streptacidiphilus griseoplanus]|uniref:phosphatidylglycerol lysyltransferase domain-containing protein n=1 Tax=Peterkaempfera griseoplana TaxID=66896 RepID=UPI000AFBE5BB|nr:phosphatidylglycerol lysyltransferase domain-containing protein [Peterkaempfera griseoplana]